MQKASSLGLSQRKISMDKDSAQTQFLMISAQATFFFGMLLYLMQPIYLHRHELQQYASSACEPDRLNQMSAAKQIFRMQPPPPAEKSFLEAASFQTPRGVEVIRTLPFEPHKRLLSQADDVQPTNETAGRGLPVTPQGPIVSQTGAESRTTQKKETPFHKIIHDAAHRYKVEVPLIQAIIMAESSYNPKAVSKRGAAGLMQLMPRTAQALGVEDRFDPAHNIDGGVRYFKKLLDQFDGDVKLALAAYNAGSRYVRQYRGIPPFRATQYYVKKVLEYYHAYREKMES
jgi:hypothetical protein